MTTPASDNLDCTLAIAMDDPDVEEGLVEEGLVEHEERANEDDDGGDREDEQGKLGNRQSVTAICMMRSLWTGNGEEEDESGMRRSNFGTKASYTAVR